MIKQFQVKDTVQGIGVIEEISNPSLFSIKYKIDGDWYFEQELVSKFLSTKKKLMNYCVDKLLETKQNAISFVFRLKKVYLFKDASKERQVYDSLNSLDSYIHSEFYDKLLAEYKEHEDSPFYAQRFKDEMIEKLTSFFILFYLN